MIEYIDLEVDDDGDLVIDSSMDLKVATALRTVAQDVVFRIRTEVGDFKPHPTLGSNAITMKGEPNTRYNGDLLQQMIVRSLTYDGRFHPNEFTVDVVPVSEDEVAIFVIFPAIFDSSGSTTSTLSLSFSFNYDSGTIEAIAGPNSLGSGAL